MTGGLNERGPNRKQKKGEKNKIRKTKNNAINTTDSTYNTKEE